MNPIATLIFVLILSFEGVLFLVRLILALEGKL